MKKRFILLIVGIWILIVGCGAEQKSLLPSADDTYKEPLSPVWKLYSEAEIPEGWVSKSYYDAQSILNTEEGYTRVWVKIYDEKITREPPRDHPIYTMLIEINCPSRIARHLRIIRRYKNGRVEEDSRMNWGFITSVSALEPLHKAICGSLNK